MWSDPEDIESWAAEASACTEEQAAQVVQDVSIQRQKDQGVDMFCGPVLGKDRHFVPQSLAILPCRQQ